MLFVILIKPKRWFQKTDHTREVNYFLTIPVFLAVGFYGGFIQMGMGIFFLAAMVLVARYNLIDSNAVKIFVVGAYTIIVIGIFQWQGLIDWKIGCILGAGQMTGGWAAAHFASKYEGADVWAYRLLVVIVILAIIKIFKIHTFFF